jgi:hypothetical protein
MMKLRGAKLHHRKSTGVNLRRADLRGAKPKGAKIHYPRGAKNTVTATSTTQRCYPKSKGAKLIHANLPGVAWTSATCPNGESPNPSCRACKDFA